MNKISLNKPVLICLYGYPGSGKSYLGRNLTDYLQAANISADRIRGELFAKPRYDNQENAIVLNLMNFMTEEFLNAGVSVVYDINASRQAGRRKLRELAEKNKAAYLLVWLQIDIESAYARTQRRDRRTADDKNAQPQNRETFNRQLANMQNPEDENYLVISGKHAFMTQKSTIINRLYQMGLVTSETVQSNVAKPGLVNLIPQTYLTENTYRNISIN